METPTESSPSAIDLLSPVAGWEAAARWNRATFDWVAKGWQQWLALMTTVPPHFAVPVAPVIDPITTVTEPGERALARASAKAPATRRRGDDGAPARKAATKGRRGKPGKPRSRG